MSLQKTLVMLLSASFYILISLDIRYTHVENAWCKFNFLVSLHQNVFLVFAFYSSFWGIWFPRFDNLNCSKFQIVELSAHFFWYDNLNSFKLTKSILSLTSLAYVDVTKSLPTCLLNVHHQELGFFTSQTKMAQLTLSQNWCVKGTRMCIKLTTFDTFDTNCSPFMVSFGSFWFMLITTTSLSSVAGEQLCNLDLSRRSTSTCLW